MDLSNAVWRKSSRSGTNGGNCVEVAHVPAWRTSSRSGTNGGECVEVAGLPCAIAVRDSKNPGGAKLAFPVPAWSAFLGEIKSGRLDLP